MASLDQVSPEALDRVGLYKTTNASSLVGCYQKTMQAVEVMSEVVHQYPNTKYSKENAQILASQANALYLLGREIREWHRFLHPETEEK